MPTIDQVPAAVNPVSTSDELLISQLTSTGLRVTGKTTIDQLLAIQTGQTILPSDVLGGLINGGTITQSGSILTVAITTGTPGTVAGTITVQGTLFGSGAVVSVVGLTGAVTAAQIAAAIVAGLPTTLPSASGQLWNNGQYLAIS